MIEAQADLEESREIRIKRLTMRSMRRGIKEMDILLSGFAAFFFFLATFFCLAALSFLSTFTFFFFTVFAFLLAGRNPLINRSGTSSFI